MINVKPEIVRALEANQALISLLGGNRLYQLVAPNPKEFPRITFFEMDNFPSEFGDNRATASTVLIQIDIWWTQGSAAEIATEVDRTMTELGFIRFRSADLPEYDESPVIFHKAMRYKTKREEI